MTLSVATISEQSGLRSYGHNEILYIPQSFSITVALPSDCLA